MLLHGLAVAALITTRLGRCFAVGDADGGRAPSEREAEQGPEEERLEREGIAQRAHVVRRVGQERPQIERRQPQPAPQPWKPRNGVLLPGIPKPKSSLRIRI